MKKLSKHKLTSSKAKINSASNNIKFKKSYFGKDYKIRDDNEENSTGNNKEQTNR